MLAHSRRRLSFRAAMFDPRDEALRGGERSLAHARCRLSFRASMCDPRDEAAYEALMTVKPGCPMP